MHPSQRQLPRSHTLPGRQLFHPLHQCKIGLQCTLLESRLRLQPPVVLAATPLEGIKEKLPTALVKFSARTRDADMHVWGTSRVMSTFRVAVYVQRQKFDLTYQPADSTIYLRPDICKTKARSTALEQQTGEKAAEERLTAGHQRK